MRRLPLAPVTGLVLAVWPILIWLGVTGRHMHWVLPGLGVLLLVRLWSLRHRRASAMRGVALLATIVAGVLVLASMLLRQHGLLLYYPVVINGLLLGIFGLSLWRGMPFVERIARWRTPDLPAEAVRYTYRVTQVWTVFFTFNAGVALQSCLSGNLAWWALWNGGIAYGLMGILMLGEYGVRCRVMRGGGS